MTSNTASRITKDTLIPLALVITIVVAAWGVATDRQRALGAIEQHEKRISTMEEDVRNIRDGVQRIELKLGTTPGKP